jgi:CRP/FNR family cyclic AMP-dependent transcriptional regulator
MSLRDLETIQKPDFFASLDASIIRNIAKQCFDREFNAGEFMIRQGESGLGLYFITEGRARVEVESSGSTIVVAELGAGDSVGELAIVDDRSRSASVICTEPVKCMLLTRDSFSKLMNKHPQIAIQMVKVLAARVRTTNDKLVQSPAVQSGVGQSSVAQSGAARHELSAALPEKLTAKSGSDSVLALPTQIFDSYNSAKGKVKDVLLDAFAPFYAARAVTRFSMAVIGCPVTVHSEESGAGVAAVTAEGVKVCFVSADGPRTLGIHAYADGEMSVAVLYPGAASHFRAAIRRNDRWRLHISPSTLPPGKLPAGPCVWMEAPNGETIDAQHRR